MRRLTLILSDLYLPEEAGSGAVPHSAELPALEWLLRFARRRQPIDAWRAWLATELGRPAIARIPVAQFAARAVRAPGERLRDAWLATPVILEARLDHVRLRDRGLVRTSAPERAQWCEEFAHAFGGAYRLHDAGPRGFVLTGLAGVSDVATVDPARLLDCDVGRAIPPAAARELRRLGAEIEMWMHGAAANAARTERGLPAISTLWLWGGGASEPEPEPAPLVLPASISTTVFNGEDPWLAALSRAVTGRLCEPAPAHFDALAQSAEHAIVELTPMSGVPQESLASLESGWFTPLRAALERGAMEAAELVANDLCFRIWRRSGWRFWRRRGGWVEHLMRPAHGA